MKKISKSNLIVIISFCVVFVLSAIISGFTLFFTTNTSNKSFSVDNMTSHIEKISEKQHSIYDKENLEEVRNYIVNKLNDYGVANSMITHKTEYLVDLETQELKECEIKNIYAEIPGRSGVNILLMAHYDSSPYKVKYGQVTDNSHGAFDDGYGVATLLELARVYAKENNLVNGIKFAFFDAEEVSLGGSNSLMDYKREWLDDVNIVINVEGRGNTGPVYLFETSKYNGKLINFYQKAAGFPMAFSVAADVYRIMPNATDLSVFIDNDFNCLNLATLDGLKYYHTENDNFSNIDKNSLKAYCNTLLPLLEEYTLNNEYSKIDAFECDYDSVFCTVLPNVMINMHPFPTALLILGCVVLVLVIFVLYLKNKKAKFSKIILSIIFDILTLGVAFGAGFGIILLLCAIFGLPFNFMFVVGVPFDKIFLIVFAGLTIVLTLLVNKLKFKLKISKNDQIVGGLIIYSVLTIVGFFVLIGVSIIFLIPLLLFGIAACMRLIKNETAKNVIYTIFVGIASIINMCLFIYFVYSIFVSLSFGSLAALLLLVALPFVLINPNILNIQFGKKEQ